MRPAPLARRRDRGEPAARPRVTYRKPFDILAEIADSKNEEGGDSASQNRRHSVWSAWQNACRTFWLDPQGWGTEKMLAFEVQFSPKP
jgi:hypothetical protein